MERGEERRAMKMLPSKDKNEEGIIKNHSCPHVIIRVSMCHWTCAQISSNCLIYYSIDEQPNGQ